MHCFENTYESNKISYICAEFLTVPQSTVGQEKTDGEK